MPLPIAAMVSASAASCLTLSLRLQEAEGVPGRDKDTYRLQEAEGVPDKDTYRLQEAEG
jgi:hypothetical protein